MTRRRWFPWAVFATTLVSAAPLAPLIYLGVPKEGGTANCGGIGFGETPCGWNAVGLTLILLGVPYALLIAVVLGLSELLGGAGTRARSVIALVGLAIPWLFVGLHALRALARGA